MAETGRAIVIVTVDPEELSISLHAEYYSSLARPIDSTLATLAELREVYGELVSIRSDPDESAVSGVIVRLDPWPHAEPLNHADALAIEACGGIPEYLLEAAAPLYRAVYAGIAVQGPEAYLGELAAREAHLCSYPTLVLSIARSLAESLQRAGPGTETLPGVRVERAVAWTLGGRVDLLRLVPMGEQPRRTVALITELSSPVHAIASKRYSEEKQRAHQFAAMRALTLGEERLALPTPMPGQGGEKWAIIDPTLAAVSIAMDPSRAPGSPGSLPRPDRPGAEGAWLASAACSLAIYDAVRAAAAASRLSRMECGTCEAVSLAARVIGYKPVAVLVSQSGSPRLISGGREWPLAGAGRGSVMILEEKVVSTGRGE